jgi:hypothetical protein
MVRQMGQAWFTACGRPGIEGLITGERNYYVACQANLGETLARFCCQSSSQISATVVLLSRWLINPCCLEGNFGRGAVLQLLGSCVAHSKSSWAVRQTLLTWLPRGEVSTSETITIPLHQRATGTRLGHIDSVAAITIFILKSLNSAGLSTFVRTWKLWPSKNNLK